MPIEFKIERTVTVDDEAVRLLARDVVDFIASRFYIIDPLSDYERINFNNIEDFDSELESVLARYLGNKRIENV